MPKNESLKKILVLGSGPIKIGEAGEFDYSGSQCLKAIHEDGINSVKVDISLHPEVYTAWFKIIFEKFYKHINLDDHDGKS